MTALAVVGADLTLRNESTGQQDFAPSLNPGDALAATTKPALVSTAINHAFNGTTFDRLRTAQAADAGASVGILAAHGVDLDSNNGTVSSVNALGHFRSRTVSGTHASQAITIDLRNLHDTLSIHMAASAGTATLLVEVSADNVNFITIDSITAAQFIAKVYGAATAGASAAAAAAGPLAPLSFRYVRITAGDPGVGNTTTLTIGAK